MLQFKTTAYTPPRKRGYCHRRQAIGRGARMGLATLSGTEENSEVTKGRDRATGALISLATQCPAL